MKPVLDILDPLIAALQGVLKLATAAILILTWWTRPGPETKL